MAVRRITTHKIQQMKRRGEPIPMVTAYDYTAARIVDASGIPMILVGDSMGHVVLGFDSTIPVTVDDIVRASAAVVRGTTRPLIVADMPFLSYQIDAETALRNAARLIQEGGAQAVKLEGGTTVAPIVRRLADAGVAVMGHIGLTPQHVNQLGGYRIQGKSEFAANWLKRLATDLGGSSFKIESSQRAAYHASAVMACGLLAGLTGLAAEMWEPMGIERADALKRLIPLLRATVDALDEKGLPEAITGPFVRGDVETIASHLEATTQNSPETGKAYAALALANLHIAKEQGGLSDEAFDRIKSLLSD